MEDFGSLWIVSVCVGVWEKRVRGEAYVGTRAALQLGLDFPGKRRLAVLMQDYVVALGVDVLGIDEKSVHVEETGADSWEPGLPF